MGKIKAICISQFKGTPKLPVNEAHIISAFGIENDAHAGLWHRQISLLPYEKFMEFKKFTDIEYGAFGENLLISDIDFSKLKIGSVLKSKNILLEITQIGKKCHSKCGIFEKTGSCIMPEHGIFAKALSSGIIFPDDEIHILPLEENKSYSVSVITASDRCFLGSRQDISGRCAIEICEKNGFLIKSYDIFPDDKEVLSSAMKKICDENISDLIITTGGTGLSPKDVTPEATLEIAERNVPGISEAMRANSIKITKKAALSRGVSVIRKNTLIINLPGSPKAVRENLEYISDILHHGLDTLKGNVTDC